MNDFPAPRKRTAFRDAPSFRSYGATPPAPPAGSESWRTPWVQLKYFSYNPCIYRTMIKAASSDARAGALVHVYDKGGKPFGVALYNRPARVPLRVLRHGDIAIDEQLFPTLLENACALRCDLLRLDATTDAYRVVHSDGDFLSGLVVDRYADTLSLEVHSLGIYQRLPQILAFLHKRLGTSRQIVSVEPRIARMEDIRPRGEFDTEGLREVKICENGVRYAVNFEDGHKTGFFCDQRPNRERLTRFTQGARMLDLCCYTGGFAISAKLKGGAESVTAVGLGRKGDCTGQAQCEPEPNARRMGACRRVPLCPPNAKKRRDVGHGGARPPEVFRRPRRRARRYETLRRRQYARRFAGQTRRGFRHVFLLGAVEPRGL